MKKSIIQEFKEFAIKGNMMDLAIGMIIGAAFTAIVGSLVGDIVSPLLGVLTGNIDFTNLFVSLDGVHYDSLAAAEEAGGNVLKYGSFISAVISFFIMTIVVFAIVKVINTARTKFEKPAEEEAPTTKACPFCKTDIAIDATRCPNCTSMIEVDPAEM